jgi:hypothetical protein
VASLSSAASPFPDHGTSGVVNGVTIEGQSSNCTAGSTDPRCQSSVMLQAAAAPGTAAPGPLPRTGAEIARSVAIALLAVGIGFVMLAIDRRVRRRRGLRPS